MLEDTGLPTVEHQFTTRWWEPGPVELLIDGDPVPVEANPFSPAAEVDGLVASLVEVEDAHLQGRVVLLGEDLAPEPLIPKAFPFLALPEHSDLLRRVEFTQPVAVVTVSAGAPILEDPDLPFPSVTVRPEVVSRLAGRRIHLRIGGAVHHGSGVTISARSGQPTGRVVVSAHVDSKVTTPGAFDNAGSVAAVLAWAEAGLHDGGPLELVLFNGEDHFDNAGEQAWLAANDLAEVVGNVNIDGAGVRGRRTSAVLLGGSPSQHEELASFLAARDGWEAAAPWFEGDHAIFAMQGIPALAITTSGGHDLLRDVAHTPHDTVDLVDLSILGELAASLDELVAILHDG